MFSCHVCGHNAAKSELVSEVFNLEGRRVLVVEYKGEDRWSNDDSKEKRAIGELWANASDGHCLFVMPNGPDWIAIRTKITTPFR